MRLEFCQSFDFDLAIQQLSAPEEWKAYDAWVSSHPDGSLWQSTMWAAFRRALGEQTRIYALTNGKNFLASSLVTIDRTAGGLAAWDIPRGPLWDADLSEETLAGFVEAIARDARADRAMTLTMSPLRLLAPPGYRPSGRFIQPEATRIVRLDQSEENILSQMKPKGRYNIRLAERHGVRIEESRDIDAYIGLAKQTGQRDKFTTHAAHHYRAFLEHLKQSFLLLAYGPNGREPAAGLLGVTWNGKGIYYYGASSDTQRHLMAPYLLQWEAMRLCKQNGCKTYDLFGIAPAHSRKHPWAGITDFKAKFGGEVVEYPPEQQVTLRPMTHRLLQWKRKMFK